MKIYVFNLAEQWTTSGAEAIVAETKDSAIAMYGLNMEEYTVEEYDIVVGLTLIASGYDQANMLVELP